MWPTSRGRIERIPLPNQVDGLPEFEVREILDSRIRRRTIQYLVDWVGYDIYERSWQPIANLSNAQSAISDFHLQCPDRPTSLFVV